MRWCKQKIFYPKFLRQILYVYAHFRVHYIYESKPETCTVYAWQKEDLKSFKKMTIIIFNSSINKLYLQLKRKNSLTEHENMWKTKKKKKLFEMLSLFDVRFVSFWKLPTIWTNSKSAIPYSDSVKDLRGRESYLRVYLIKSRSLTLQRGNNT